VIAVYFQYFGAFSKDMYISVNKSFETHIALFFSNPMFSDVILINRELFIVVAIQNLILLPCIVIIYL